MRENFVNPEHIEALKSFVYKNSPTATPLHLSLHNYRNPNNGEFALALRMNGNELSKLYLTKLGKKVDTIKASGDAVPSLDVIIVSGNSDSERYINQKAKAANKVGIDTSIHRFELSGDDLVALEEDLIQHIESLNFNDDVNGIKVQLPLPKGVDKHKVLATICSTKDVDGFAAQNLGSIFGGSTKDDVPFFVPCTARGIVALLDHYAVLVTGKNVCIIVRSCIVGLPTQLSLMKHGATVTSCDCNTTGLSDRTRDADIVIACAGSSELVKANWIKPGAVVVDVGFHVVKDSKVKERILEDVDAKATSVASLMTPVPGGVGPMTVASLLENKVDAYEAQRAANE